MENLWWKLPGPDEFVGAVAQSLREGRSAVLCLPEHLPGGLRRAIQDQFKDSYEYPWRTIKATDDAPMALLYSHYGTNPCGKVAWTVADLVQEEAFTGKFIWVEGLGRDNWPAWSQFLAEYEQAARGVSVFERTVFCVPLTGEIATAPPGEDVTLSVHRWHGIVQDLDILIFTTNCFKAVSLSVLRKQLAVAVTASLALWDPSIPLRLAVEPETHVHDPVAVLADFARERGWGADAQTDADGHWCRGISGHFKGREQTHSGWLAINGCDREVYRRIWAAQMAVMLPYVEESRQHLLTQLSGILKIPFRTRFGEMIENLYDLEIGHIEAQISVHERGISPSLRKFVRRLRRIRNSLAHLEPLSLDLILSHEVDMGWPAVAEQQMQDGL